MTAFILHARPLLFRCVRIVTVSGLILLAGSLRAKNSSWKDAQGASFRGEPREVLGPWALLKTGPTSGQKLFLHTFSPADSVRFYEEVSTRPALAKSWAEAKGVATQSAVGRLLQLKGKTLVPADLAAIPEPQLLLVLVGSHNDGGGWELVGNMMSIYQRIQRVYPGLVGTIFLGTRHNNAEHREMAVQAGMPWLIADFTEQSAMTELRRYIPNEGTNLVLISREGVPLLGTPASNREAVMKFSDQLSEFLSLLNPSDARGWKERINYFSAIRPVQFAHSSSEPMLIGSPLRMAGLRKYGVTRVNAHFDVAANGKVTATLRSTAAEVPPVLVASLTELLHQSVILPAIDHGNAVAGGLDYILDVPPADRVLDADIAWLGSAGYPEISIGQWLVLRPIKVPEVDFTSTVEGETPAGTLVFKALQVSDAKVSRAAQMNAFNSDFFGAAGAGSVRPKEGDKQTVDGIELTWQRVKAEKGFVDLRTGFGNVDYSVGYATAEFEVPAEGDALLGIGSDDGMKIWLNGEMVHDKWIRRPSRIDDDVVPLHLKAGKNRFLIKIQNAAIDWSFIYRLRIAPR